MSKRDIGGNNLLALMETWAIQVLCNGFFLNLDPLTLHRYITLPEYI